MPSLPIFLASQTFKIMPANRSKSEETVKIAAFLIKTVFFKQIAPKVYHIVYCMRLRLVLMSIEKIIKIWYNDSRYKEGK